MPEPKRTLYPGNSDNREDIPEEGTPEMALITTTEDGKIKKKPLSGTVVKRKTPLSESFAKVFFGEHAQTVVSYILNDVLIPAAKDTIATMVKSGIEMLVYGETRNDRNRRDREGGRTVMRSYDRYYDERDRDRSSSRPRRDTVRLRSRYNFDEILFTKRADADYVLSMLDDAVSQYGQVTVAEFFDAAEMDYTHADEKYGWESLSGAGVHRVRDGWILELPNPVILE